MGIEFVGKSIEISPNHPDTMIMSYSRDAEIRQIMVKPNPDVTVTSLRLAGVEEFITGHLDLEHFKEHGNVYDLPEAIPYPKEAKLEVGLFNRSSSTQTIYIAFVMVY